MRDEGVKSGTAILFWAHGGTREPDETIAPSYEAELQSQTLSSPGNFESAPWIAHERFAPPGPGLASLPTVRLTLPLFGATNSYAAAPPELPEALLDEPAVLEHIAALVEVEDHDPTPAIEVDPPADQLETGDPEFAEGQDTPPDWLPPEPPEPVLENVSPPSWGTTTDAAGSTELADGHGYPVEPIDPAHVEQPPLASTAELDPVPPPPAEEASKVLSWLDGRLRRRREQQADLIVEPELYPFPAPPTAPAIIPAVVDDPRQPEPQGLAPEPPPQAMAELDWVGDPVVVLPPPELQTEPQRLAPEPAPVEQPGVDAPRSGRVEPRLPKRPHLPSLFTPAAAAPPVPAVALTSRLRRFASLMWHRPAAFLPGPSVGSPALPAEIPTAVEVEEPSPTVDLPPIPPVVEAPPPDRLIEAAPEPLPPPIIPLQDEPPVPAQSVPHELAVAPTPETRDEPAQPIRPAAYWAEPNWTKSAQTTPDQPESLAWTPPPNPLPGSAGARRTTPAVDGLWEAERSGAPDAGSASQNRTGRRIVRHVATIGGGVIVLAAAAVAVFHFLPRAFVSNLVPAATFNAPMMVLRANGPGRVVSIAVQNGQTVDPNTLLLTIRTEPQPDPAAALLRARLEAAQARLADLDQSLAQATPVTDAGRARIADLRRQRAAAVIDVAQLQDGVTNIPAAQSSDLPVKAGVHGVIRSLEARSGTTTAAGVPLVRMLDCDHAFLTVGPDSKLHAGQAVQVQLPNLPPVAATVRQSAGIAEPPDSLVIAIQPGAFVGQLSGSCPIGATATVTPSITGS